MDEIKKGFAIANPEIIMINTNYPKP